MKAQSVMIFAFWNTLENLFVVMLTNKYKDYIFGLIGHDTNVSAIST